MPEPYQVVSSKRPYQGKILSVRVDEITLPNGRTAQREIVERGSACGIVPVDKDGMIILVRQYRHALGRFTLEIPAGMMDAGEDPAGCAARELEEEIGRKAGKLSFLCKLDMSVGFCTEELYLYLAQDLTETAQNLDEDEFIEIERRALDEAVGLIASGEITDSKTVAGLLAVKAGYASFLERD